MAIRSLPVAWARVFAMVIPILRPVKEPGPLLITNLSISPTFIPKRFSKVSIIGTRDSL